MDSLSPRHKPIQNIFITYGGDYLLASNVICNISLLAIVHQSLQYYLGLKHSRTSCFFFFFLFWHRNLCAGLDMASKFIPTLASSLFRLVMWPDAHLSRFDVAHIETKTHIIFRRGVRLYFAKAATNVYFCCF